MAAVSPAALANDMDVEPPLGPSDASILPAEENPQGADLMEPGPSQQPVSNADPAQPGSSSGTVPILAGPAAAERPKRVADPEDLQRALELKVRGSCSYNNSLHKYGVCTMGLCLMWRPQPQEQPFKLSLPMLHDEFGRLRNRQVHPLSTFCRRGGCDLDYRTLANSESKKISINFGRPISGLIKRAVSIFESDFG